MRTFPAGLKYHHRLPPGRPNLPTNKPLLQNSSILILTPFQCDVLQTQRYSQMVPGAPTSMYPAPLHRVPQTTGTNEATLLASCSIIAKMIPSAFLSWHVLHMVDPHPHPNRQAITFQHRLHHHTPHRYHLLPSPCPQRLTVPRRLRLCLTGALIRDRVLRTLVTASSRCN